MSRRQARKHLFNLVFQTEFNIDVDFKDIMDTYSEEYEEYDPSEVDFIKTEYEGIVKNIKEIDSYINRAARGWSVERLSKVDLAILRLATYEIMYSEIPDRVSVNEAVELAKEFGENKSASFINGVLGGVVKNKG